ncbi:helix-turn-helix domain-containing protein [Luteolibacter pohnpeiensis]|nr:helix-turn-helix domain-containing protein [Luteolibacter pohnpeiensis]
MTNRVGLHRHGYFEVFWLEGKGFHLNDFHSYPIDGTTLIFVTPGQVHAWSEYDQLTGVMMAFTQEFFDGRCGPPSELLQFPFWFPEDGIPMLKVSPESKSALEGLIREMESEYGHQQDHFESVLRWLLRTLFVRAGRIHQGRPTSHANGRVSPVVRDFHLLLETRFKALQKVSDYAKQLGLSSDRLSELTKSHTGSSAGELIRGRLLLESQRLLAHTHLTMSEIAYELNFQDPSYFSRFFRKQTGQSPGDFRSSVTATFSD